MRNENFNVGIVGATGLVGEAILRILEERAFPVGKLRAFASSQSAGKKILFREAEIVVEELKESSFDAKDLDFVFFAGGGSVSAEYAPLAADSGAIVIDNSSHFRMDPDVPLIVPEVNPQDVVKAQESRLIANPNCSTAQLVVALKPLHDRAQLKRVVISSYQSVSGAGLEALDELQEQVSRVFSSQETEARVFPHQIAFNCIPHIDVFLENGMTKEEMKMINETRKILNLPDLKITATAVRVPVFIGHSESVNLEFEQPISPQEAQEILSRSEGLLLEDDPGESRYPLAVDCVDRDEVFVGRIRQDESVEYGLHLWIVADNLRKGAATNAIQIAELCLKKNMVKVAA